MNTINTAAKINETLVNKSALIVKGNSYKGIAKGEVARNITVEYVENAGYRVIFKVQGRLFIMWAASAARFANGQISLNTGDPTPTVKMTLRDGRLTEGGRGRSKKV